MGLEREKRVSQSQEGPGRPGHGSQVPKRGPRGCLIQRALIHHVLWSEPCVGSLEVVGGSVDSLGSVPCGNWIKSTLGPMSSSQIAHGHDSGAWMGAGWIS